MVGDLSEHFSRHEFDSHDGGRANPHPDLIAKLERLRAIAGGKPLVIVSGYRTVAHNTAVHGAKRSMHLTNRAADLRPGAATVSQAIEAGFTGIGYCGPWARHVDVRPGKLVLFKDC